MRKQPVLQLARQQQILFQPLLLPFDLFVEPRVFNRNRNLRRQRLHHARVLFRKVIAPRMLQVEHSDHLPL